MAYRYLMSSLYTNECAPPIFEKHLILHEKLRANKYDNLSEIAFTSTYVGINIFQIPCIPFRTSSLSHSASAQWYTLSFYFKADVS